MKVDVLADEREAAVNRLEERLSSCDRHHRVEVGHHDGPARAHDAGELGNGRSDELDVAERERAHREIELAVVDRECVQIAFEEASVRNVGAREFQHLR